MDPNACVSRWQSAVAEGRLADARESSRDYREWTAKGGFLARVAVHPATDAFMQGRRYASVARLGHRWVSLVDDAGRRFRLSFRDVEVVTP